MTAIAECSIHSSVYASVWIPPVAWVKTTRRESGEKLAFASSGQAFSFAPAAQSEPTGARPLPSGATTQTWQAAFSAHRVHAIRLPSGAQVGWSSTAPFSGVVICFSPEPSDPIVNTAPQD